MRTVLVTGCAGFIGSHLSERLLKDGYRVLGIDNFDPFYSKEIKLNNLQPLEAHDNFKFYETDICHKERLAEINEKPEVIIHLAAKAGVLPSLQQADKYIETNISGTNNLLEWMRDHDVNKMLFASSSSIYGNNKEIPFRETDAVSQPISPYAFTKRSCELMNYSYHHLYGFSILNLRLFTVYGPRQRPDLAIHKFVKRIDEGQAITMYGDGGTARDYTYVQDTVNGFIGALHYILSKDKLYDIVNLGNNQPVKLKTLIDSICQQMDKPANIEQLPMQPGDVDITYADISKAQQLFGYQPSTSLETGLKEFINWFNGQKG